MDAVALLVLRLPLNPSPNWASSGARQRVKSNDDQVDQANTPLTNGEGRGSTSGGAQLSPESSEKLRRVRAQVTASFSQVVMGIMMTPRYRHQALADLDWLVLEPLLRDRIAIASAKPAQGDEGARLCGNALIW